MPRHQQGEAGRDRSEDSATSADRLSQKRADMVKQYHVGRHNIDERYFTTEGTESSQPIALNDTKDGCAMNRGAEIIVMLK